MMEPAQRLSGMRESFIREMTWLAITYQAINLSQGFPDFDPPHQVIDAAHQDLDSGMNQYGITWGTPTLRQAIAAKMKERTVTISGFGKTFAATGWRLGYACALDPLSTVLRTIHDFTTICAPVPLQAACVAALNLPDAYYHQLKRDYAARCNKIMAILKDAHFTAQAPEGAFYVMADFSAWGLEGDDYAFARMLPEKFGVAVVPGSCFYATPGLGKRAVRFAFAKKLETLDAAGERLRKRV